MHSPLLALPFRGPSIGRAVIALIALMVFALAAHGAGVEKKGDSAPALVSTKGPVPKWNGLADLQLIAAKGDPEACFELATRYLDGNEVVQDTARAIALFEQAAKGGVANASFRLGKIYFEGISGPADYARALEYYLAAAQAGVLEAQHNIGAMLVSARGVKRDFVEGLAWLIVAGKSLDDGEAEARVRTRLAKRPADIVAAEERAVELSKDLSHATVRAVFPGAVVIPPVIDAPPKPSVAAPVAPKVEKSTVAVPKIEVPAPMKMNLPAAPEVPSSSGK